MVVRFVAGAKALEDLHGFRNARLVDRDPLQTTGERAVLLDVLVLFVRGRADDPKLTGGQHRLDQRRQIHRAAGGRAGADRRVDLVNEQDRQLPLRQRVDHRLEAFLEVTAEARAGEQGAGIEREHLGAFEEYPARRPAAGAPRGLGDRGLADPGIPDEHRIVLPPPAQDLDRPLQLVGTTNQRIELAVARPRGEVGGVSGQRIPLRRAAALTLTRVGIAGARRLGRAGARRRHLGEPMREELRDVEERDPLRREQLRGVRLRLLQRGHDHVASPHFLTPGTLDLEHCGLEHAAERQRLLRLLGCRA